MLIPYAMMGALISLCVTVNKVANVMVVLR